ncbi:2-iminoacetate synthase ThiH [Salinimonas chungwhensis]|uniref:2-iminoacetate synthase ThiH n=1 Tax=Salinimonas chungwhensis TaxID=265425 RepID=UPI000367917B|nr:2-iminoacetate synthase ThiH [Salinimonas chungwhensis]
MTPVADALKHVNWEDIRLSIPATTPQAVQRALATSTPGMSDFMALISPAAEAFLEPMAQKAHQLTRRYFGNAMSMFVPLYLSNLCANECSYCGFTMSNRIKRKTLDAEEIEQEALAIKQMGFRHILIVTGEHETKVGMTYFKKALAILRRHFDYIMMEVQPLSCAEYLSLRKAGVSGVLVYQETYHRRCYAQYHLRGTKKDFDWRLETADRLGQAGIQKIGVGALLGLADWRTDSTFAALHAALIQKHYWRSRCSIAFPRLRPCEGSAPPSSVITDKQLVQLICAHRILHPQAELSLSTRESSFFRDNVATLGITSMSAASQTQPGGYSNTETQLSQFDTEDTRSPAQVASALQSRGIEPVWQDWLAGFGG